MSLTGAAKPSSYGSIVKDDLSIINDNEAVPDYDDFSDGGSAAWLTVFGAFLALFCSFGQMNAFGTFQTWYTTHQLHDLHPSTIAWIGSVQLWVFFFSGGFIGRVFDMYGPRMIMALGTAIYVSSMMLTSVARDYTHYLAAQGILSGLGVGMLFYPPLASISTHFRKYRATALGIAMAGSGIGGTVYPILLQYLFVNVGFAWGVRVSAIICFVMCTTATFTVTSGVTPQAPAKENMSWLDLRALKDPKFALLVVGSCFMSLGLFTPFCYLVSYASDHGVPSGTAFYVLAVLNAASVLGRVAPAHFADAFGRFTLLVPCAFLAGLSTVLLWPAADSLFALVAYAAFYGVFSGAFNALIVPCIAQISDIREIGMRIGLLYSIISFPSLVGNPAAGALLHVGHGSYTGLILLSGTSVMVGSGFMLLSKLKINSDIFARV
ncbi:MFS general substrate transporter [Dichomitus squalens LYAD-421 SS1]|uniref:MFS general substrate transporter n=1 Tax=Dichomitus squalens (strain LYAD-421) TaxID=732165 RepID=R7SVU8_DICSQ|nr:MFS general substrate transporter [Dichomitus squalens LYAD-421 SS1]EJF59097.1 MFS general substrate transporter [Dichomitus squalens LYAD-421 SS1]